MSLAKSSPPLTYIPLSRGLPKAGPNGQPRSRWEQKSQWCCRTPFRPGEEEPLPRLRRVLREKQVWERHKRKCVYLVCYTGLFDDLTTLLQSPLVDGSTKYVFSPPLFHLTPLTMAYSCSATPHYPLSSLTRSRWSAMCG